MGSLWAKFKGMKLWLKIVIIIGILTVIGMIYNAVTGVPNNSNVNANENSVSNVSQSSAVVSSSQPLQEDSKPQEQSKLQEQSRLQEESRLQEQSKLQGQSRLQEESRLQEQSKAQQSHDYTFILNTQSKVYHLHECSAAKRMSSDKKSYVTINAKTQSEAQQQIEAQGYKLCGICSR